MSMSCFPSTWLKYLLVHNWHFKILLSCSSFPRNRWRLKEWTITFPLKSRPGKRKRQSCNVPNWFCKRKVPKSQRIQPSREFWQQKVIFQLSWVEFIIIGVYISLREEVGVLLEEPASMIANPLFSLISWFRKQYCHKHKYKHTNIIVNPIFSLVFSNNVNKNCFIFRIFPHIMVYGQIIKSIDFKVFFSLCVIYIKKIVILQQLLDFYRPSRTVCQTTIWIVDPWQVHLAPHWTDFLHQWILQIATSHRASISYHLYHQCGFASFYKMQSIWNTQCREVTQMQPAWFCIPWIHFQKSRYFD